MSRYEQYLDDFGSALSSAVRGRARRARRRVAALVTATAAIVVAVLVGLGTTPGVPGDVVGRALAAVSAPDGIVHYRAVETSGEADVAGGDVRVVRPVCSVPEAVEVWQARTPLQWRVDRPARDPGRICGSTELDHRSRPIVGPRIYGYLGGATTTYYPETARARVISGYPRGSSAERLPVLAGERATSHRDGPIAAVRELLRAGKLSDAGQRTLDGRAVRRLVGEIAQPERPPRRVVFDVDAESFEPVRFAAALPAPTFQVGPDQRLRHTFGEEWWGVELDFTAFEVLPDDAANRARLAIELPPGTDVERTTQRELRREIAERRRARGVVPRRP